jgi:anaphase-promoting complex subunit 1
MADVTSLGVHTPTGLPYLINEGILPADPKKELYQWDTCTFAGDNGPVEEEILASKDCVVWSQNGVVRTVYRFDLEGEHVRRAVLTRFPKENGSLQNGVGSSIKSTGQPTEHFGKSLRRSVAPVLATSGHGQHRSSTRNTRHETSRALVVLLKTKAHVYFLAGSHHIVDLPFEIESAYAAPRGLILQKKIKFKDVSDPSSPKNPRAPNNSFFSFQAQPSASFLRSPTFKRSFLGSQPVRPSPLGGNSNTNDWLSGLFSTVSGSSDQAGASDAVRLYSLTSPFLEVGVVTESLQQPKPRITSKAPQRSSTRLTQLKRLPMSPKWTSLLTSKRLMESLCWWLQSTKNCAWSPSGTAGTSTSSHWRPLSSDERSTRPTRQDGETLFWAQVLVLAPLRP